MLRFRLMGFPIEVQPFFWLICAIFGGAFSTRAPEDWIAVPFGMAAIFVSILGHELGHAFMAKRYGGNPRIALHSLGGVTMLGGSGFTRRENIMITAMGPLVSIAIGVLALLLTPVALFNEYFGFFLGTAVWVNFIWTVFNMLPILPMDGGQILATVLGPKNAKLSCLIGGWTASLGAVGLILFMGYGAVFAAAILGFMAYQNFRGASMLGGVR